MSITRGVSVPLVASAIGCSGAIADEASSDGDTGSVPVECVGVAGVDVAVSMEPVELNTGLPDQIFRGECEVAEIADGEPAFLAVQCENGGMPLDISLQLTGVPVMLSDVFAIGASVDLAYTSAQAGPSADTVMQWAVLRDPADGAALLVAAAGILPLRSSDPAIEVIEETSCPEEVGSCGLGVKRRVAIRFTLDDATSLDLFDHNSGQIGPYAIRVGEAVFDEGNCEGLVDTWYEFLLMRSP